MTRSVGFSHGMFFDSYEEQANEQGFTLGDNAESFDEIARAFNRLCWHRLLTEKQKDMVVAKIQKKLIKSLKPLPEPPKE